MSPFSNLTPLAVPTGPAVVTSTLTVSGAGPYLADVDVLSGLAHTFSADLDVTLSSPAGTVVTLTTDNGDKFDHVFNGTLWDDDANPGGQVPYEKNNGLVTDHPYADGPVPTLVPEEALGAFIGENPNGSWTLTISDDFAGDGGTLENWSLHLSTLSGPPVTASTSAVSSTPVVVPTGPAVVTSSLEVSGAGSYLADLDLLTELTHTFPEDLDIALTSPGGTVVTLTTDNAKSSDNVFVGTLWDDDASPEGQVPYVTTPGLATDHPYLNLTAATPLAPEEALGAFIGENPNGAWTLTISDDIAGDGGTLENWSLEVETAACPPPPVPAVAAVDNCGKLRAAIGKAKARLVKARKRLKKAKKAFAELGTVGAEKAVKRAKGKVKGARKALKRAKAKAKAAGC